MNKQSVGFRFRPTDEEILAYFLEGKMSGYDFPEHVIDEIDFRKYSPWELPQMSVLPDDDVRYFFSAPSYKYPNSKRTDRTTSDGSWKVTGRDRLIRDKCTKQVIGMKKTLVFYKGRSSNTERTNWVMHEFHSNNASRYPKEFVLCRIKRKCDNNSDASQAEPSNLLPSTSAIPAADNTFSQVNHQPPDSDPDYDLLQSVMQTEGGPSHANESNIEPNLLDNQFGMCDHEDDYVDVDEFLNSLLAETINIHPLCFTPTKPLRGELFVGDSSERVTETVQSEFGYVRRTPSLCKGNPSSKESEQMQTVHSPTITRCSSNSESDINSVELVLDEFPSSTITCKSQNLPNSRNFKNESAPKGVQLQSQVSQKALPRDKARDAEQDIDLSQKEDTIVKLGEDQKTVQTTHTKTNLKPKSSVSARDTKEAIDQAQKDNSIVKLDKDQKSGVSARDAEQAIDLPQKENSIDEEQTTVQTTHTQTTSPNLACLMATIVRILQFSH